jgi:ribosomal protein S18 acetylase RimI-like enzyme
LSFCNFAAGFALSPDRDVAVHTLQSLRERVQDNRRFWLFHMAGDRPADLTTLLLEAGFVPKHGLVEMAWNPTRTAPAADMSRCEGDADRIRVAGFMAGVFFWRLDREYRDQVARATAGSGLELYRYEERGEVVGALMLAVTERSVGLYNLCVEDSRRNHGLGSALVRSVQALSYEHGLPMLLQCDSSLQPWYAKLGFQTVGLLTAYSAPTR